MGTPLRRPVWVILSPWGAAMPSGYRTLQKGADEMKRLVILLVLGTVFGLRLGAARADDLELKAAGPKDKSFQTVLSYSGDDVGKALAGGNKLKDTKKLNELIKVDEKDPLYGVL